MKPYQASLGNASPRNVELNVTATGGIITVTSIRFAEPALAKISKYKK
jgi:hypothetical protein